MLSAPSRSKTTPSRTAAACGFRGAKVRARRWSSTVDFHGPVSRADRSPCWPTGLASRASRHSASFSPEALGSPPFILRACCVARLAASEFTSIAVGVGPAKDDRPTSVLHQLYPEQQRVYPSRGLQSLGDGGNPQPFYPPGQGWSSPVKASQACDGAIRPILLGSYPTQPTPNSVWPLSSDL